MPPTLHLAQQDNSYSALRARRKELWRTIEQARCEAAEIIDTAEQYKRDLTANENSRFNILDEQIKRAGKAAEAITEMMDPLERQMAADVGLPADGAIGGAVRSALGFNATKVFGAPRPSPFDGNPAEFFQQLVSGRYSPELQSMRASQGLNESVPGDGGFALSDSVAFDMLNAVAEQSLILRHCRTVPMSGLTRRISGFDNLTHSSSGALGGLEAVWTGEGETMGADQPNLRSIQLTANKLTLMVVATEELIEDAGGLQEEIIGEMQRSLAFKIDHAGLRGTGSGQPLGVLNDPALLTVAAESGQAAATILVANLVNMYARLHPQSVGNSIWLANPSILPQIMQLTLGSGTAVSLTYDPKPAVTDVTSAGTLLGRPLYLSEHCSALGTVGDLVLADFSQMTCGMRREIRVDQSKHLGFQTGELWIRGQTRLDIQGRWDSPLTPANGDTSTWCVTLATRA